jgi:tetratricopeptide (TPR) repeat protein
MTPAARLAGGVLVLFAYAWALKPSPAAVPVANQPDAQVEQWLAASNDAYAAGRYTDALEATSRLVARFPAQQVYAERLARILGKLNRAGDEAAAWERVIDASPTPVDACPAIGDAYARAGERQKSIEAFERCVSFDPRNSELLFFLGRAYESTGRTADALDRYTRAAALDASNADVELGLARLALRENRVAEAGRAAAAVLARFPSNADALLLAGLAAEREGRSQDARGYLERALAAAEGYVDVHIALGRVDAAAGRRAEARRHFERALELDPSRRAEIAVWLERTAASR